MKFILNKDTLQVEDIEEINSGSVKYYIAEVEYDESWDDLTIEAILVKHNEEVGTPIAVINNEIYLDKKISGRYSIGFVGYKIENEKKTFQISTNLKRIYFEKGAGEIETEVEDLPTPTEWEIYIAQIPVSKMPEGGITGQALVKKSDKDNDFEWKDVSYDDTEIRKEISELDKSKVNTSDLGNELSQYVEEHKSELQGPEGPKGDKGEPGENGKDGIDGYTPIRGVDYYTDEDKQEIKEEITSNIEDELSEYVKDDNYVHTDNNFTEEDKNKLDNLQNYDDTEVRELIGSKQDNLIAGDNITIKDNVISATGGSTEEEWELIRTIDFDEDTKDSIAVIKDDEDGKPLSFNEIMINIMAIGTTANTATNILYISINGGTKTANYVWYGSCLLSGTSKRAANVYLKKDKHWESTGLISSFNPSSATKLDELNYISIGSLSRLINMQHDDEDTINSLYFYSSSSSYLGAGSQIKIYGKKV